MTKKGNTKNNNSNKRKLEEGEEDKPTVKQQNRTKQGNKIVTDDRFKSVHFDPRFQRVPKKESKVPIDSRFKKLLSDGGFGASKAAVDKRGRVKKLKEANSLSKYYVDEDEKWREKEDDDDKEEERESEDREIGESSSSSSSDDDDEEEEDFDYGDDDHHLDLITQYLMARHEDTPSTEQETHRLAIVNMDWDHIKAVDLYVAIQSCLPRGGQILSVGIYPSEYGLKCMEIEAVQGPFALIDKNEEHCEDESESDDEDLCNEELRTYELNKLRYYHGVVVFDSSATANYVYKALDGTELLTTSNVFDLRFIPDTMEFKHPPRDITTEAPTSYMEPDFHTRALQHSNVKLTWEDDEPRRTKILRRKFNPDELDEVNEYLASSGDSDADDAVEGGCSENEDKGSSRNGKAKKHIDKEKLRALLLSGDGSASDKDDDQDMEITFNTGLEDLSKRILEKKDKKSKTVWEQVLQKRSEKRKARKNRSKYSSDDDSSDSNVQEEEAEHPDDFFIEEEPLDSKDRGLDKTKQRKSSRREGEESSSDIDKEREASKAELELLFAEDQGGKGDGAKGYKMKKGKGKKGKEALVEAKLPDVDPSEDPRFSALYTSNLYAMDPTDPQFKRSAAYARQQFGKRRTVKKTEMVVDAEEATNASEQVQVTNNVASPIDKGRYELNATVKSLKRNLGNLKTGTKNR